jgi:predicted aspartyl protease
MRIENGESEMGRVTSEVVLANNRELQMAESGSLAAESVRNLRVTGIVDSGATHMVLPKKIADQLGLPIHGDVNVRYADDRMARREIAEELSVEIFGRRSTFRAIIEPDRETVLIGAIVLEDLDLLVDCSRQALVPRDPERTTAIIE